MKPLVSIVVIGRNEGERLRNCLASIESIAWKSATEHEVIYVDSGSVDGSVEIAREFTARVIQLTSKRPNAAIARNAGWREAAGEWVLFLDGDTILHPHFLIRALSAVTDESIAVVWGHRREIRPDANLFHRVLDLDWIYAAGPTHFCGGDALMRRFVLEQTGGFDESLIAGEEPELCARMRSRGFVILHIDAPMTGHDLSISHLGQYWRRATRAGYAYAQMAWCTRHSQTRLWSSEAKRNLLSTAFLLSVAFSMLHFPLVGTTLFLALMARTCWRNRWKSTNLFSLICYGGHSHLQQLPIFTGQLAFWWDLARHRQRGLIEYK